MPFFFSAMFWAMLLFATIPIKMGILVNTLSDEPIKMTITFVGLSLTGHTLKKHGEKLNMPPRFALNMFRAMIKHMRVRQASAVAVFGSNDAASSAILCGATNALLAGLHIGGGASCDFKRERGFLVAECNIEIKTGQVAWALVPQALRRL